MLRYDETDGTVSVFRQPSGNSNGNTVDRQGRLVTCEHAAAASAAPSLTASITMIADRYEGKRFNSPNDVVVKSDGSIWFTDPTYGIVCDYEGDRPDEIGALPVYRVDPKNGEVEVITDMVRPNGIAFSPDESQLYVVDTGRRRRTEPGAYPRLQRRPTASSPAAWSSPTAPPACSTASGWTATAASGPALPTASIATTPTAR